MVEIRPVRFFDIPKVVDLATEAHAASRFSDFANLKISDVKFTTMEAIAHQQTGRGLFLVADNGEAIEGCFLGSVTPLYCTDVLVGSNVFFYTSRSAKASTALRLIRGFMSWSATADTKILYRFWMSDAICNLERSGRMMESLGFRLCGGVYEKENF